MKLGLRSVPLLKRQSAVSYWPKLKYAIPKVRI